MLQLDHLDAMARCQRVHDMRRCPVDVGSPQTMDQRNQVTRIIHKLMSVYPRHVHVPVMNGAVIDDSTAAAAVTSSSSCSEAAECVTAAPTPQSASEKKSHHRDGDVNMNVSLTGEEEMTAVDDGQLLQLDDIAPHAHAHAQGGKGSAAMAMTCDNEAAEALAPYSSPSTERKPGSPVKLTAAIPSGALDVLPTSRTPAKEEIEAAALSGLMTHRALLSSPHQSSAGAGDVSAHKGTPSSSSSSRVLTRRRSGPSIVDNGTAGGAGTKLRSESEAVVIMSSTLGPHGGAGSAVAGAASSTSSSSSGSGANRDRCSSDSVVTVSSPVRAADKRVDLFAEPTPSTPAMTMKLRQHPLHSSQAHTNSSSSASSSSSSSSSQAAPAEPDAVQSARAPEAPSASTPSSSRAGGLRYFRMHWPAGGQQQQSPASTASPSSSASVVDGTASPVTLSVAALSSTHISSGGSGSSRETRKTTRSVLFEEPSAAASAASSSASANITFSGAAAPPTTPSSSAAAVSSTQHHPSSAVSPATTMFPSSPSTASPKHKASRTKWGFHFGGGQ